MSEDQGYIVKDQDSVHDNDSNFEARDLYDSDRNDAGDADARGGDNQGDINLNIEQGGDAFARGGDVVTYESYEHHTYTQYQPEYEEHNAEEHSGDEDTESHESTENVF